MKDWAKEHPWLTFFIICGLINLVSGIAQSAFHRQRRRMELEEFARLNNLQLPPYPNPGTVGN